MAFTGSISKKDAAAYSSSDSDGNGDDEYPQLSLDPHADDLGEFHPRKRRRTGGNAKERAALGIFGSESEDDGPSRKWKGKKNLWQQSQSFVAAEKKTSNADEEMEDVNDDDDEDDDDEDEYADPGRFGLGAKAPTAAAEQGKEEDAGTAGEGLGFRPSGSGLGWKPPTRSTETGTSSSAKKSFNSSTPLGRGFVPSSAHEPILKADLEDERNTSAQKPKAGTKGMSFAEKMMAKMGYVAGQGLGAEGQGRNAIIEATLRPQGVGLGAVKEKSKQEREEEKRQALLRGEKVVDSDEEEKKKEKRRHEKNARGIGNGAGSGTSTPKRAKTRYLTVNDIQQAAPGLHIPDAFAPILDMTGPDLKTLTSGSGLMTPTAGTQVSQQTEARKLARRAQADLSAFVEEWKTLEERNAWLEMETKQRQQDLVEVEGDFASLQLFASLLDEISQAVREEEWDPVIAGLRKAEAAGISDREDLANIAVAAIHPFLRGAVQGWQPLQDPKLGNFAADLMDIRGVLGTGGNATTGKVVSKWEGDSGDGTYRHHQKSTTAYESMIYKLLFPKIITAIGQQWDVYDPASLISVFDKWEHLLPTFVRSHLLEQVVRRLEEAIGNWKPRKKQENPPHFWLFPWLQHLPSHHLDPKGTGLVANVRRKFRQLIDVWEFDRGMIPGLKQWKDIFRPRKSQDHWKSLVMHHVLPSMARYLRGNFRVDPSDQEPYLGMLKGAVQWVDVIAPSMLAEVIVAEVFPLWHHVLYQWLTSDETNYEEVGAWFEWWKDSVFPAEIGGAESIMAEFDKGTAMIEDALDLGPDAKVKLQRPDKAPALESKARPNRAAPVPISAASARQVEPVVREKTFRDVIEDWCIENDLRFMPTHKSTDQGDKYVRITARMDGKGGTLAYFRPGGVLVVESRKFNMELQQDKKEEWGLLLDVLFKQVDG